MLLESLLSFFHISAFLGWLVFATSLAVMCRRDWMSEVTLQRLLRMDRILWIATAAVLLTGLARIFWGAKGASWYAHNWLLTSKIVLFLLIAAMQVGPARQYRRWARRFREAQELPTEEQVKSARRWGMIATHVMAVIPLPAVFLARGFGG